MQIYNYHPKTGEYLATQTPCYADQSPRDPGKYLIPAHATSVAPPVCGDNEVAVFTGGAWAVKLDFRDVPLFKTADGAPVVISDIGVTPDDIGATDVSPPNRVQLSSGKWSRDPAEIQADTISVMSAVIQQHLDTVAQSRKYDDIVSLCSYATSQPSRYATEGQAGLAWRSAVWEYAEQVCSDVLGGLRAAPTEAEIIAELPVINW